jgi:hypothetical protein
MIEANHSTIGFGNAMKANAFIQLQLAIQDLGDESEKGTEPVGGRIAAIAPGYSGVQTLEVDTATTASSPRSWIDDGLVSGRSLHPESDERASVSMEGHDSRHL